MTKSLTIITVLHNSGKEILGYLETFLEHHNDLELNKKINFIFVDNSAENKKISIEYLSSLIKGRFEFDLLYIDNKGFGHACNYGVNQTNNNTLLIFINPDTLFKTKLYELMNLSGWGTVNKVDLNNKNVTFDLLPEYKSFVDYFKSSNNDKILQNKRYIVGSFIFIESNLYKIVKGFDEQYFMYCEDIDICQRLTSIEAAQYIHQLGVVHLGMGSSKNIKIKSIIRSKISLFKYLIKFSLYRFIVIDIIFEGIAIPVYVIKKIFFK